MDFKTFLISELSIDKHYFKLVNQNVALCLVHKDKWLKPLLEKGTVPEIFVRHETLSDLECNLLLFSPSSEVKLPWILINLLAVQRSTIPPSKPPTDLNYFEFIYSILSDGIKQKSKLNNEKVKNNKSLYSLYPKLGGITQNMPAHITPIFGLLEMDQHLLLVGSPVMYTLQECIRFSPALIHKSSLNLLFLVYQLLHISQYSNLTLDNLALTQSMWVQVLSPLEPPLLISKPKPSLTELVSSWVEGHISNFDYIMELNSLVGRETNNPQYHPIMPWVTDFSKPNSGWRDLSKSKFRLNKGDRHLDLTFETSTHEFERNDLQFPHHFSEVLSDITFYVYKARNLSKELLCQHVRSQWVPAEYPASIQRLQEWSPDECIPEFFTDPTIFGSIHPDMADLGIPPWCENPTDFIQKHKEALESPEVSECLHLWIDLTFGFRLQGSPALQAKNVCLPLVDLHQKLVKSGMVQLFFQPHPQKKLKEPLCSTSNANSDLDTIRPELYPIYLPTELDPVIEVKHIESLNSLLPSHSVTQLEDQNLDHLSFYCLLAEIVLSPWLQCNRTTTLTERYNTLVPVIKQHLPKVSRYFHDILNDLLQLKLVPPQFLLQPLMKRIPFPPYFYILHTFLNSYYSTSNMSRRLELASTSLESLLQHLTREGVILFLPFLQELFEDKDIGVLTAWNLFAPLASALSSQDIIHTLVPALNNLYSITLCNSVKLYHRAFLIQLLIYLGLKDFLQLFSSRILQVQNLTSCNPLHLESKSDSERIPKEAAQSVIWLANRLGPLLTARHITRPLLGVLTLCYLGSHNLNPLMDDALECPTGKCFFGDQQSKRVVECLSSIAAIYGESFILLQYIPYVEEQVVLAKRRLNDRLEAGLIGGLHLIGALLPYLSDATLMDRLQSIFLNGILIPLLQLNWSVSSQVVFYKWLNVLYLISVRIGPDMASHLLTPLIGQFFYFCTKELENRGQLAYLAYISFYQLLGRTSMEQLVHENSLTKILETYPPIDYKTKSSNVTEDVMPNVNVVGNRLDVIVDKQNSQNKSPSNFIDQERHLRGNWLAYWEHELGRPEQDTTFNFKQIFLQAFVGHSGSVGSVCVLNNENSFITGSKDKTVKLWSLRNGTSSTTSCQWTYSNHRKTVFAVTFLESIRMVGSCDTSVHIWDPFLGSCLKQFDSGSAVTALAPLPAPSVTFVCASTASTLKFLDTRTLTYMQEFKVALTPSGLIRSIAVSPSGTWVAVGLSTGHISVLDIRTGRLLAAWTAHDSEILQLKPLNKSLLVSTSLDQSMSIWNVDTGVLDSQFKGCGEPIITAEVYEGQVIGGSTANKLYVHSAVDVHSPMTGMKLRPDHVRGNLMCLGLLPLNRQLLLGSDSGSIILSC